MKHQQAIAAWLRKRTAGSAVLHVLGAVGLILLGAFITFITFWVVYVIILVGFYWLVPHSHTTRLVVSGVVIGLLFVYDAFLDYRRLEREMLEAAAEERDPDVMRLVALVAPRSALAASPKTWVKLLSYLACGGPRLVSNGFRLIVQAWRLRHFDAEGCAAVLTLLYKADSRISLKEIDEALRYEFETADVLEQMRSLDGVLFLRAPPAGLKLTDNLRQQLRELRPKTRRP